MKISVVVPSFNQAGYISQTLKSILDQQFEGELEVVVVDGGSTDGTVEILERMGECVRWVSEPDEGQADAINKGVSMTTGDLIGWLNSDDLYLPGTLRAVIEASVNHPENSWFFGKCQIIDGQGKEIWKWVTRYKNLRLKNHSYSNLLTENYISQPAVFFTRELFLKAGALDKGLNFAMDYDLWLRFAKHDQGLFVNHYLSSFRRHGESKSETDFTSQFREQYEVALRYHPGSILRARHWFNIHKIILAYRLIKLVG